MPIEKVDRFRNWALNWRYMNALHQWLEMRNFFASIFLGVVVGGVFGGSLYLGTWVIFWVGVLIFLLLFSWFAIKDDLVMPMRRDRRDPFSELEISFKYARKAFSKNWLWFLGSAEMTAIAFLARIHPSL